MEIISFNVGYFLGYDGSHSEYLKNPKKAFRSNTGEEKENLEEFLELINSEDPDVVALQEVDDGSLRSGFGNQVKYLSKNLRYDAGFNCKYSGLIGKLPLTRNLGNLMLYSDGDLRPHRVNGGQKDLVQELVLEEFSIFSVHLATLGQWTRRRQLRSLSKILECRDDYLIVGDWNTHNGEDEIKYARKVLDCEIKSPGKTFPADNPNQKLDLVASKEVNVNIERMKNTFSDHRPVKVEIT